GRAQGRGRPVRHLHGRARPARRRTDRGRQAQHPRAAGRLDGRGRQGPGVLGMALGMISAGGNIIVLAAGQALTLSAIVLSMTLAGIVGAVLAPDKGWATLPVAAMVLGTAVASIPASLLMRRIGRR